MKRFVLLVGCLMLGSLSGWAADYTSSVNTLNGQLYNKGYRDVKDGTNAETFDCVSANASSTTLGTQNLMKASAGYLHALIFNGSCFGSYSIADSATGAVNYATTISTVTSVTAAFGPASLIYDSRFNNGLAINGPASTCTVTASYR